MRAKPVLRQISLKRSGGGQGARGREFHGKREKRERETGRRGVREPGEIGNKVRNIVRVFALV